MGNGSFYDAVIVGGGHNGLVAACYLAGTGLSVLVLEKNGDLGGATLSKTVFAGVDARLSVYSYLVSLLPGKILSDLGIAFQTRRRATASYTPVEGRARGLLISNQSEQVTRESFAAFAGEGEFRRFQEFQEVLSLFAAKTWPTLLEPLLTREQLRGRFESTAERAAWEYIVEKPLACLVEDTLEDDAVRGLVFTDAKIGVPTHPDDPTLLQNRTFLYHIIGQGTGEWRVPVGGMGALVAALLEKARSLGAEIRSGCEVTGVERGPARSAVHFRAGEREQTVDARWVLFNTSSDIADRLLPGVYAEQQVEGTAFKINMLLERLPALKDGHVTPEEAFAGTFHLNEGYEQMKTSYQRAVAGKIAAPLPGEMYCHSLTDPSILGEDLRKRGWQTLTLFGLDAPYRWFEQDGEARKAAVLEHYLDGINRFTAEDIRGCLARDARGQPCIEAKSALDLEAALGLPKGNIFHGNLTWPFAEEAGEAGQWGVETNYANVLMCGSSAKRGGAVSGIPGHNAAMKVLGK